MFLYNYISDSIYISIFVSLREHKQRFGVNYDEKRVYA